MSEEGSSAGQPVEVAVIVEGGPLPAAQSVQPEAPLQTPLSAFREPADLPAAAANAPSMDGTAPATAEGKLPPRSCAKRGRGGGGRGRSNLGKRRAASEAGEESQEPEEEKPLPRRTSKRERTKPQAYSPTNQDKETKLRRQAMKLQEREGSQALSEDVSEPRRPPLPARKVVNKEEAPEQDSSDEDQPLKLTRRSVSVATSELPAARPAAGPPAPHLPSADGDGSLQEARAPSASTGVEPGAMPVEPNLPEPENAKTAEAQPLQTTEEQPPQIQATEAQPPPAAVAQPLQAAEAHPVTTEVDLPPAAGPQQTLAAAMGPDDTASRPAVQGDGKATQDAEQAAQVGEGPTEAPEQGTQAAGQATQDAEQAPAAAAGPAPPETPVTDAHAPAAVGRKALPAGTEEQPAEAPAAAQEPAAEPKQEKGSRPRKRQKPAEGLEDGSEEEAKGANAAADDRDHEEAGEGGDPHSGSVESDPAAKGSPPWRGKTAGRKRLRKAEAEPSPAKPQQQARMAGVEHEVSREVKPAAKQQGPEAAAASPPDAAADPSHQPAPQDSRQGPPRQRSDEGLQPGKAAEVPLPGAGGTPRERLARDVAQRNERLSSGLEQVTKIFKQAQQQASEALTQMAADISHLDSLTMTEELLQQTAIGRTMRALAKPMRPLQSAVEVERKAAAVVSRWMKTFQSNKPQGAPVAAAPAGSKTPQAQAHPPSADQPAQPAVQAPPAASQPAAPAPPVAPAGTTAPAAAADAKPAAQRPAQQHAGPQPTAPVTAAEDAAKPFAQTTADAAAPPAAQPVEVLKKEQIREEARTILEAAFMPRGTLVPPKMAAGYLESAVFEHHEEDDLGSGKNYLRQLHLLWNWLAPEGESYQPELAVMVASGNLHPADLATMSEQQLDELCDNLPSEDLQDAAPELPGSEHPAYGDSEIPS